jgi:hypothetical protein
LQWPPAWTACRSHRWGIGGWQQNVLTHAVPGAPKADGDPTGYSFEAYGTQHVVYRAEDGGLRELWWDNTGWHLGQFELASPNPDSIGRLIAPFFYEDQSRPHTFFVEPSLVEKAVHEWEQYVVTPEEFAVTGILSLSSPVAWFPGRIDITPAAVGILPKTLPDPMFEADVLLSTPKGTFGASGGVRFEKSPIATPRGARVLNTAHGFAPGRASLATVTSSRGGLR